MLIGKNFVQMVHDYDKHQKTMRIQALKTTRRHLAKRFIKLFRLFRHKKHGEPYDENQSTWNLDDSDDFLNKNYIPQEIKDSEVIILQKIKELQKALYGNKDEKDEHAISDLHTVNEDYDDENDDEEFGGDGIDPNLNPNKFVRSTREYEDHIEIIIETNVIVNELKEYMKKVNKVKNFLRMVIHRNRFLKKREGIKLI